MGGMRERTRAQFLYCKENKRKEADKRQVINIKIQMFRVLRQNRHIVKLVRQHPAQIDRISSIHSAKSIKRYTDENLVRDSRKT